MFIHLGEDVVVRSSDVITIIDHQLLTSSSIVNEFLDYHKGKIVEISSNKMKSIVVTIDKVYFSPLSSSTLKKRAQHVSELEKVCEVELIQQQ